jgi:methionine synthase II (cobalamin-independent)
MIGADCVSHPANFDALLDGPASKSRTFGLVNARNTRLETIGDLTRFMDKIARRGGEGWPACWLTPSAALEFLPYRSAIAKMNLLTKAVEQYAGTSVTTQM